MNDRKELYFEGHIVTKFLKPTVMKFLSVLPKVIVVVVKRDDR